MVDARKYIGRYGEGLACDYLQAQGYTIVVRNYRLKNGELDIIARRGDLLICVEVKTRKSLSYGYGLESINWKKQQRIRKLAEYYYASLNNPNLKVRIDVVDIVLKFDGSLENLRHIENAF